MGDNDNSTNGYGGSDGGYGGSDTDTDSSYGGGYDGGYGGGDDDGNDDDGSDTGSYGNDGDSNDDYGGYDDSNDNSSYSEADDGITADDISVSPYSSCEDIDDVFDTDLDQTFSAPSYGGSGGWYESITAECEQAYNAVADTLSSFVDTLAGEKKDAENMPTELNTTDSLANIEYQSEKYLETKMMPSEMPIEHDTTDSVTDSEAQGVSPDTDKVSVSDINGERVAELASGLFDIGTGFVQTTGGLVAIGASGGLAGIPVGFITADGANNFVYGVGEVIAAVKDDPNYAWNPLESGYEDIAETLGVSKQTADELYDMQEYVLSFNGVRKDLGKLAMHEISKTNIAVDGIGVAKNLYTTTTDQYKSLMEQMEKRDDNAADR